MIVVFKPDATQEQVDQVAEQVTGMGLRVHFNKGAERTIMGAVGDDRKLQSANWQSWPGVEQVIPILAPYKLVSRDFQKHDSSIDVRGERIGAKDKMQVMAGPCSVESVEQMMHLADVVKTEGLGFMRGGAYKPRTSPYAFQGLESEGLDILMEAKKKTGLRIVTELMDPRDIPLFEGRADVIQIGARNMQNFRLLKEVGQLKTPVLLKRGLANTLKELLMAAEYIAAGGNLNIILCERGIRTFETDTRNTFDVSAIPVLKEKTHLPVIADPSHAGGRWDLVEPLALAAVAAGADGLIVEIHHQPEKALCDGDQALKPPKFVKLMEKIRAVAKIVGRDA
ncbi:MAG: 3-deoxy-7-phosphoheptulonate synthase [Deltaproteobacteria bacterium]|nr:3-deoxy-7-phosphoheptulonate synthase [Deltaproteobacteria bacterium]